MTRLNPHKVTIYQYIKDYFSHISALSAHFAGCGVEIARNHTASAPDRIKHMPLARATEFVDLRELPPMDVIFGQSSLMAAAREKLERVADTTVPVLLQGESGTGKEIFAKLLHARSNRSKGAWVKVTCPAIPHSLIESELFGYEKGAFTGAYATKRGRVELAHMGTLFLDEVGGLDMSIQAKLLQVLQDGSFMRVGAQEARKVNTRLVCAANREPAATDRKRKLPAGFLLSASMP